MVTVFSKHFLRCSGNFIYCFTSLYFVVFLSATRHVHPCDPLNRLVRLFNPILYRLLARVILKQYMRLPNRGDLSLTQLLAQLVTVQVIVYDAWQAQPLHHIQHLQEIINSFCRYLLLRVRPSSLSANVRFSPIFQRVDRYNNWKFPLLFLRPMQIRLNR